MKSKEGHITFLEAELRSMQRKLNERDVEISRKDAELHKLKSVLQQASNLMSSGQAPNETKNLLLNTIKEQGNAITKKMAVSGQSVDPDKAKADMPKIEKDFKSRQLIKEAIMENDFLRNLEPTQVREIVDYMDKKRVAAGSYVIKEGDNGSHFYVSSEGEYEVSQDGKVLRKLGVGKAFGELALLYNCKRTASIRALTNGEIWMIDRDMFQHIMVRTGVQRRQDLLKFLKVVPLLAKVPDDLLLRLSDSFELLTFSEGDYIVRQGMIGDTFYVVSEGKVRVTKRKKGSKDEEELSLINRGGYFGEQALLKTEVRTASVIAASSITECLALDKETFYQLVGDLKELQEKNYADLPKTLKILGTIEEKKVSKEFENLTLNDFEVLTTLGAGGFGRVELVQLVKDGYKERRTFALKCMKKKHIVDTQQQEHVYHEKRILMSCNHPFITK